MTILFEKENFIGPYLPFEPLSNCPLGSIVEGKNLQRRSILGGWAARTGSELLSFTDAGSINALHEYKNLDSDDFFLFVHVGQALYQLGSVTDELLTEGGERLLTEAGEGLLATTSADVLNDHTTLGTALDLSLGPDISLSSTVDKNLILTTGVSQPLIYGGNRPKCDGFVVYDGTTGTYIDFTQEVNNSALNTYGIITAHAATEVYIGMKERGTGAEILLHTANTETITTTLYAMRSGSWTAIPKADGTESGGAAFVLDGSITWTASALDQTSVIANKQLYWYRLTLSAAPSATYISDVRVYWPMSLMTNKWDGTFRSVLGCLFYDSANNLYRDKLGAVTDGTETNVLDISGMVTGDYVYFKVGEPLLGVGIAVASGKENTNAAKVDGLEYFSGTAWTNLASAIVDNTLDTTNTNSFSQSGTIWVTTEHVPLRTIFKTDHVPGYWYRLSVSATLSATVEIAALVYASRPKALDNYTGCTEFDGKLILWGSSEYPNRLIVSNYLRPDQLCNIVDKYTRPFGNAEPVLNCIVIGQYLGIWKRQGFYLLASDLTTLVRSVPNAGLASINSLVVASTGDKSLKEDEVVTIAIWQSYDGIYKCTESGQISKISGQIRGYFDSTNTNYIGNTLIRKCGALYDDVTDTYRFMIPANVSKTLVYSVRYQEWFTPWEYYYSPSCGKRLINLSGTSALICGSSEGYLLKMDHSRYWDEIADGIYFGYTQSLKTRPVFFSKETIIQISGYLRRLWLELKANTGYFSVNVYTNRSTTAAYESPAESLLLSETGKNVITQLIDLSEENINCFQIEISTGVDAGQALEIYGFAYFAELLREFDL